MDAAATGPEASEPRASCEPVERGLECWDCGIEGKYCPCPEDGPRRCDCADPDRTARGEADSGVAGRAAEIGDETVVGVNVPAPFVEICGNLRSSQL